MRSTGKTTGVHVPDPHRAVPPSVSPRRQLREASRQRPGERYLVHAPLAVQNAGPAGPARHMDDSARRVTHRPSAVRQLRSAGVVVALDWLASLGVHWRQPVGRRRQRTAPSGLKATQASSRVPRQVVSNCRSPRSTPCRLIRAARRAALSAEGSNPRLFFRSLQRAVSGSRVEHRGRYRSPVYTPAACRPD